MVLIYVDLPNDTLAIRNVTEVSIVSLNHVFVVIELIYNLCGSEHY
jgi:hypothetical protein